MAVSTLVVQIDIENLEVSVSLHSAADAMPCATVFVVFIFRASLSISLQDAEAAMLSTNFKLIASGKSGSLCACCIRSASKGALPER